MENIFNNWIDHLLPIIEDYKCGSEGEPLDGDDVDKLCETIKAKINLHEGNITETEYLGGVDYDTPIKPLRVENITAEIHFEFPVPRGQYDLGVLTLECEGRRYVYDVVQSYSDKGDTTTSIRCEFAIDEETFPRSVEYPYDLRTEDLYNRNLKATLFIGDEYDEAPESMSLAIRNGGNTFMVDIEID